MATLDGRVGKQSASNVPNVDELGPCPQCGKLDGTLSEGAGRFPFTVRCRACGWTTGPARIKIVAEKLWNEAKPAKAAKEKGRKR